MRSLLVRTAALSACGVLLIAAYHHTNSANVMADAANHFLDSLTPEERAKATMDFAGEERMNWHFIPKERMGLPLREMSMPQKHLAEALLSAGLSQEGAIKAHTIMSLDDILRIMEKDNGERRNPDKYYFSIFGKPAKDGTWGYRVEGHHLSQNYTIVNGKVVDAPSFFGANPAKVLEGPRAGLRVLANEEDSGRELFQSLTEQQKKVCLVDGTAYKDIITFNSRKAAIEGKPSGLPGNQMNAHQMELLASLVQVYADNVPEQMAQARMDKFKAAGKNVYFAWAGGGEVGAPHYYRVQTPAFLIEYDDTQNNANHIHSVWRDFDGDFGLDMLKMHYQASH